jgi:hypothetical protein
MDERKLKSAFLKVKSEMNVLDDNVAKLQMQVAQSVRDSSSVSSTKSDLGSKVESSLVDRAKNLEVELNSVKTLVSTLSSLVEQNTHDVRDMKSELKDLREDFDADGSSEAVNRENIYLVNTKLADFQELINGKLTLEIAGLRLEFTEEIANVFDNMTKGLEKVEAKANIKKSSAKKEKILEEDYEILTPNQKTLVEEVEFEEDEKKPSRFKKAIKWLFVDEEEDELESLKKDMKDEPSEKKEK